MDRVQYIWDAETAANNAAVDEGLRGEQVWARVQAAGERAAAEWDIRVKTGAFPGPNGAPRRRPGMGIMDRAPDANSVATPGERQPKPTDGKKLLGPGFGGEPQAISDAQPNYDRLHGIGESIARANRRGLRMVLPPVTPEQASAEANADRRQDELESRRQQTNQQHRQRVAANNNEQRARQNPPTDASGNLLPRALATAKPKPPAKPAWLGDPATTAPIPAHSGRPADSSGRNRKQPAAYVPVKDAPRRWGSRTGRHTLEGGQLIGMAGNGQVVIRRPDGKTTSPHISDLSDDDVAYLQQVRQQQIPDSVFPEVAPVQQNAFAQAGRDMSARNRRQLDAKTDRLGRQFAAADKRMAEEKRRMQAGMRPEIVSEQEHAMFGLPPDAPDAAAGGPTPAMQQRMQMTDRNRERDAQAQAIGRVIRRSQQVNDDQRRAIAQRYGVDPQVAGGWENMQDVHDFEMGVRRSDRRRAYAIRGITDRYSPELAAQGVGVADLEKIYDEAEAAMPGSGPAALNNHGRAGRIALQGVRDGQARNNIRANAADDALSRGLRAGRGPGIVARGAVNARTPAEKAATAAIAENQGMPMVAEAMLAPEQAAAKPAEVPWADLGAIWTHLQTLPPEARAAEAQMIMPNANPEWIKSWVDQRNRAAGQEPPSNSLWPHVLRFFFPPPTRRDVPGMGSSASNPAAAATGYLDPRSVAAGRNAGSVLTGFMG